MLHRLPSGSDTLAALEAEHGPLPATLICETPRGGIHVYLAHDDPDTLRQGANTLGQGIDSRMPRRGYVGLPPSRTVAGVYRWRDPRASIAVMPAWVAEALRKSRPKPRIIRPERPGGVTNRYVQTAVEQEARRVATAVHGCRNDAVNLAGFSLGTLVGAGLVERGYVEDVLLDAAAVCGVLRDEPKKTSDTLRRALDAGEQQPRQVAS